MSIAALNGMEITAKKDEVLAILRQNREQHAQVVAEAREGYVEKAKVALAKKLKQLAKGRIVGLAFSLNPPQDYTDEYDTIIRMLELDTHDEVDMNAHQVRCFVQDKWDWSDHFLMSNSAYSATAASLYHNQVEPEDEDDDD